MEEVKIRELPVKPQLKLSDYIIVEDDDGTKVSQVANLITTVQSGMTYNCVEDMKNARFNEGDVVTTLGYHTKNDGGGAQYIITYAPADTNDGGSTIYLYTSDTLRAKLIHHKKANVIAYGAHGDGSTDDYDAFANAIASGLELEIPSRQYYISNTLKFNKVTSRVLDFNGSTLICPVKTAIYFESCEDITVRDLQIEAYQSITLHNCDHIILDHVDTSNSSLSSIDAESGLKIRGGDNIIITNSKIGDVNKYCTDGISMQISDGNFGYMYPKNVTISNSIITAKDNGISVAWSSTPHAYGNNIIIDNSILMMANDNTGNGVGVLLTRADNLTVKHSAFKGTKVAIQSSPMSANSTIIVDNIKIESASKPHSQAVFNIGTTTSNLYINGAIDIRNIHPSYHIFKMLNGVVYIIGEIINDGYKDDVTTSWGADTLTGRVFDYRNGYAITKEPVALTTSQLTFDEIRTAAIEVNSTTINAIESIVLPHKIKNQLIYLYAKADTDITIVPSGTIDLGADVLSVQLDPDIPVILKNIDNIWKRIH